MERPPKQQLFQLKHQGCFIPRVFLQKTQNKLHLSLNLTSNRAKQSEENIRSPLIAPIPFGESLFPVCNVTIYKAF